MRRLLVAGNWKMNASKVMLNELLASIVENAPQQTDVVVFPPAPYLMAASDKLQGSAVKLGGQNINPNDSGAYTGEISASMMIDCGCEAVLVGHSERRTLYAETDADVLAKTEAALNAGLIPYVCIGETLAEREANQTEAVIEQQINAVLNGLNVQQLAKCVFAYEPVWAIGTGKTASPEQAQQVHAFIRGLLAAKDEKLALNSHVLYGGSVKADNAKELFAQQDIDGGLVGGASLKAEEFLGICNPA
ncbi:Triosephosphate isomerase [Oleispira antarctica RB-8]|uniref:Triosephosphate isomerase n=1 Tax=Oleispira antarctica RB-8 TaxID=698738 RepID=R4YQL6_OLEAN|nr:Triosephosphate isomerase [Oleispira antarctica RB-8]